MFNGLKDKEVKIWAVVVNGRVIDTHIGHPDQYSTDLFENVDLVEYSKERNYPSMGDIWTGERFIKWQKNLSL